MSLFDGISIDVTHPTQDNQSGFEFPCYPVALSEKYRPQAIEDFAGLDKVKPILRTLAAKPFASSWVFVGPPGVGKTTVAQALAKMIPAELHHIPSQECNVANIDRVRQTCQYLPMSGFKFHLVLADEADMMTPAAQVSLLSKLDSTNPAPNTIWIFTCNDTARLEPRFMSRCRVLEFSSYGMSKDAVEFITKVWDAEAKGSEYRPNFARIVKESNNNIRAALMSLETELMSI